MTVSANTALPWGPMSSSARTVPWWRRCASAGVQTWRRAASSPRTCRRQPWPAAGPYRSQRRAVRRHFVRSSRSARPQPNAASNPSAARLVRRLLLRSSCRRSSSWLPAHALRQARRQALRRLLLRGRGAAALDRGRARGAGGRLSRLHGLNDRAQFGRLDFLGLLELFLIEKAVLVEVHRQEQVDGVGGQLDPIEDIVLVGVDLLEFAHRQLTAQLERRHALGLGLLTVGRTGDRDVLLHADLAVIVLVELIGTAKLHVDEFIDRHHALTFALLDLLALRRLPLHRALHDQAQLGLGQRVVAICVVLVEFGIDDGLDFRAFDEAVTVGVEVIELRLCALATLLKRGAIRRVARERWLRNLEELVERQLAVLVGVELVEGLHAVLEEIGARDLPLFVDINLGKPGRQRDGTACDRRRRGRGPSSQRDSRRCWRSDRSRRKRGRLRRRRRWHARFGGGSARCGRR